AIVRPQESIFALSRSIATRSPANLPLSAITHLLKPGSDQYPVIYHFRGIGSHAIWKHFRVFRQTRTWTVCTQTCEEEQQQDTAWSEGWWCVLKLPETGSFDTRLAFFIRIWEGFMALKGVR